MFEALFDPKPYATKRINESGLRATHRPKDLVSQDDDRDKKLERRYAEGRLAGAESAQPLEAFRRPKLLHVVVRIERPRRLGKRQPRNLRARVDVDVGLDRRRIIKRACADEPDVRASVGAEDGDLASRAAIDLLPLPA